MSVCQPACFVYRLIAVPVVGLVGSDVAGFFNPDAVAGRARPDVDAEAVREGRAETEPEDGAPVNDGRAEEEDGASPSASKLDLAAFFGRPSST